MLNVAHYKAVYFLRYTHPRFMKLLFSNIQKQVTKKIFQEKYKLPGYVTVRIRNVKFSCYCFYMNQNIYGSRGPYIVYRIFIINWPLRLSLTKWYSLWWFYLFCHLEEQINLFLQLRAVGARGEGVKGSLPPQLFDY